MNNEQIAKPDVKEELKVGFIILCAIICFTVIFSEYRKSYLTALTEYEISHK